MNSKYFLLLILISFSSVSAEVTLVFREGHFMNQYHHDIYIDSGQYIYIDDHFKLDKESKWIPSVPILKAKVLNASEQENIINSLLELGVNNWAPKYPVDDNALLCDGLSFTFYLRSAKLNILSSGGCRFPPNYEKVRELLESL